MKVEARIFNIITLFFFVSAAVYGFWSKEPVGIVALLLTGGLALIIGTYFQFVARRIDQRPEDMIALGLPLTINTRALFNLSFKPTVSS